MKTSCFVQTLGVLALLGLSSQSFAQTTTAASDPVGFVTVNVPANSDAVLAVPLSRASVFKGVIQSISGNTITVAGTSPAWTTNQFVQALPGQVNTYAVQIASGTKEGMTAKVTANAANTVTIELSAGDDLSGIQTEAANGAGNGDNIDILPYWTPSSLLTSVPVGTEFLGFEGNTAGVNLAAPQLYGNTGPQTWEDQITTDDASHLPIGFGRAFVLRNNSGSSISVSMAGSVPMSAHRFRLFTLAAGTDQDIRFGYSSPVPEAIINLGIPAAAGDAILGFDNAATGKNKAAATIYAFDGTQWVDDITGEPLTALNVLQPGFGYIYRKFRAGSPQSAVWQHVQSYLN